MSCNPVPVSTFGPWHRYHPRIVVTEAEDIGVTCGMPVNNNNLSCRRTVWFSLLAVLIAATVVTCTTFGDFHGSRPSTIPLGDYSYAIAFADRSIKRVMEKHDIPAVLVALIDDQHVLLEEAYGVANLSTGATATPETIFKAGSIAKLFTGIEIMRMHEEGLIELDEPVNTYLPDFSIGTRWPDSEPVTIRNLLSHRSGLPRNGSLHTWHWDAIPNVLEAQTRSVAEVHQAFPAGYRYKYSNIGYDVLGRIIEVVRGVEPPTDSTACGFPYYMEDALLDPIGMTSTSIGSSALLYGTGPREPAAMGYYRDGGKNIPYTQFDIINLASGNLHTTLRDMAKFAQFLLAGGSIDGRRIISPQTLSAMYEVQYARPSDPQTTSLTWFVNSASLTEQIVLHTGTYQGFISFFALIPEEKLGLVFLANSDEFEEVHNQLAVDILGLMLETKTGVKPPERPRTKTVEVDEETLRSYEGKYIVKDNVIEIAVGISGLRASYNGLGLRLNAVSTKKFTLNARLFGIDEMGIEFLPGGQADGKTMLLTLGGAYHIICPRYPVLEETPLLWSNLEGDYKVYPRHVSEYSDPDAMGSVSISVDHGVLKMSDGKFLLPLDEGRISIVGGIYDGEIMELDEVDGTITWQNFVYLRR